MDEHKKNTKYQDILKTAHDLFWKHGIKRVTIQEVCREAKVSKMTFYRFFENKVDLAKKVLQQMFDEGLEKYRALMAEDISFEEKVKRQIMAKFEGTKEISSELVKDIYTDKTLGLHDYWEKRRMEMVNLVLEDYADAQKKGWIRKDINLNFIFYFNGKVAEWIYDPVLKSMYDTDQEAIMEITKIFFYGIFPRSDKNDE
ncbi:MAG: TetR/AcrR family transcriptional regulator [Bacteroidetes bacterium]|nr:MAG: TetR/AcrR family transcriptional regulator [Bacteroidota bacterium]